MLYKKPEKKYEEFYVHRSNLTHALQIAIETNQRDGKGFSTQTMGWQQILEDIKKGKQLRTY
jgi:hypothetical protein